MRKVWLLAVVLTSVCLLAGTAKADTYSDFKTQINALGKTYIEPFAKDLGGLIGGADFNSGRALGFPGFEAGVAAVVQSKPDKKNLILKNADVDAFGLALVHAGVGLPIIEGDLVLRGISYSGFSIIGGGLRYPIYKSGTLTKFVPDVSLSGYYDVINYTYFKGTHMSVDVSASLDIPVIKPFAGIGYDMTTVEIKGVSAVLNGKDGSASEPRYTLGVKFIPLPLTYLYGAYSMLHGQGAFQAGFGARF